IPEVISHTAQFLNTFTYLATGHTLDAISDASTPLSLFGTTMFISSLKLTHSDPPFFIKPPGAPHRPRWLRTQSRPPRSSWSFPTPRRAILRRFSVNMGQQSQQQGNQRSDGKGGKDFTQAKVNVKTQTTSPQEFAPPRTPRGC